MGLWKIASIVLLFVVAVVSLAPVSVLADAGPEHGYQVQPGDVLQIAVWKESDLTLEVLVRPDGAISLPLIGEVRAASRTVSELRDELLARYGKYIPDTDVFVGVRQLSGNKIYVLGKVSRPGEFALNRQVDVMQALSMAGGTTAFAEENDIKILRRTDAGQQVFDFRYGAVESGMALEQNILLESGDVVVVP